METISIVKLFQNIIENNYNPNDLYKYYMEIENLNGKLKKINTRNALIIYDSSCKINYLILAKIKLINPLYFSDSKII